METDIQYRTINEICQLLGISRATVYRWVELGLPCHQPAGRNGRRLFNQAEVDDWLRSRCSPNAGDPKAVA